MLKVVEVCSYLSKPKKLLRFFYMQKSLFEISTKEIGINSKSGNPKFITRPYIIHERRNKKKKNTHKLVLLVLT